MMLYVYTPAAAFEPVGVVDAFSSLRWVPRFYRAGEFELHCPVEYFELLALENIVRPPGSRDAAIVETREITQDDDGKEELTVKGRFLSSLLARRIVWGARSAIGANAEVLMRSLVDTSGISTTAARVVPALSLGAAAGFTETTDYQGLGKDILAELEVIAETADIGFRIAFAPPAMKFECYRGVNRIAGTANPAIFSRGLDSLTKVEYMDSTTSYRNIALVGGEESDTIVRAFVEVGSAAGLNRRELFVDAGNVKHKYKDVAGIEHILTEPEYLDALAQKGWDALAECFPVVSVSADAEPFANLVYKTDYDLGDTVTVLIPEWGVRLDTRITEIEEIYEDAFDLLITFGKPAFTLIERIKRMR